ncbi:uncharacterized protein LOC111785778 [Cucurbita pepo subsp. pepo]|uniref:uncharacterized protein LOC111785778 n=1 Tax=Cucurbita pepo subsp. pepo TaxID=3664 RepID=UPI000C9D90EC|nr:uncharacterized protein LOC111785778 [Cucurbita pepo subsp. pepo]
MAVEDDFSFPTVFDSFTRCSIDSPPLWRASPAASPISDSNFRDTTAHTDRTDRFAAVTFTSSLHRRRRLGSDEETEAAAAEKMDVLWENLNEDLSRNRRSRLMKSAEIESVEIPELDPSEKSRSTATRRKKTTTGIVKVLKKLFLLQNTSRRNLETRSA